ncbi:hypothetical protein ACFYZ8_26455 [Streptomyces sp. NPDC001668]
MLRIRNWKGPAFYRPDTATARDPSARGWGSPPAGRAIRASSGQPGGGPWRTSRNRPAASRCWAVRSSVLQPVPIRARPGRTVC